MLWDGDEEVEVGVGGGKRESSQFSHDFHVEGLWWAGGSLL